jgi:hypothetical protein
MNTQTATPTERLAEIQAHLATKGNKVMVCTYTRGTVYDHRHIGMFKATEKNLFVQRGKAWDCIDGCGIRFGTTKTAEVAS